MKTEVRLSQLNDPKQYPLSIIKFFLPALGLLGLFTLATFVVLYLGVEVWGINIPVAWGFAIINFVWWVGIGHAGTFISAFLLLMSQKWRNSINRLAETMTLFAIACAGVFPILHLGRPWYFYWLFPYPDTMNLYPQYRSALVWDAFAITTYLVISAIFWYIGMIPDLAIVAEKSHSKILRKIYGLFSLGWSNRVEQWKSYQSATKILAGLATPLVISVHSVVSLDFAIANVPGWHSTIFPPYFVAGAIYSGFAMILCLLIPIRKKYKLEDLITVDHLDKCAKLMLLSGMIVTVSYLIEFFLIWYSDDLHEFQMFKNRAFGDKSIFFWSMLICNCVCIQILWWKRARRNLFTLFCVSLTTLIGMWLERAVIILTSLEETFLPAMNGTFSATKWDWALYMGTFGIFFLGILIVLRFFPFIPIVEVKELKK